MKKMKSRAALFNEVFFKKPNFSSKNLSYIKKATFNAGKLIPLGWLECHPGCVYDMDISGLVRTTALASPMYQQQTGRIRLYVVPFSTIVFPDDYERALTGGESGTDRINFPLCEVDPSSMTVGSLYDYLDLPLPYKWNSETESWDFNTKDIENVPYVSPLPFLAYHRIYNDYYRNEETETYVTENPFYLGFHSTFDNLSNSAFGSHLCDYNGDDLYSIDLLHNVGWPRDYFTSALKQTQRGGEVYIPIAGNAPVSVDTITGIEGSGPSTAGYLLQSGLNVPGTGAPLTAAPEGESQISVNLTGVADLSKVSGIGAIALRLAMNLQSFLEKDNLAGYRLQEHILAHYGIHMAGYHSHCAKYIGGVEFPVTIDPVVQTSASEEGSALGNMAGRGVGVVQGRLGRFFCDQHCIAIPVLSLTPSVSMGNQGLDRRWTRKTYLDYPYPEFQDIGEQEILNQEVFFDWYTAEPATGKKNDDVWAYQYRYADIMYQPDRINGDFRTTMSFWHQARMFAELPLFNNDFIKCDPSDRVFALDDTLTDQHYQGLFKVGCKGILPFKDYPSHKLF